MRILALALSCLVVAPAGANDITVIATPVPLNPNDAKQTTVDSLEYVAGFALNSAAPEWGGYSGMVMAADGSSLLAVSDVGHWLKLELKHDATGTLTGVGAARIEPLLDEAGKPVAGKEWSDAEDIAQSDEGQIFVSFERRHRIWRYASATGIPEGPAYIVSVPDAVKSLRENSGIEAMIAYGEGDLAIVAEGSVGAANETLAWDWSARKGAWQSSVIERSDGFEPTSLALLPSPQFQEPSKIDRGLVLLLERRYTEADGPAARVSVLVPSIFSHHIAGYTLATLRLPLSVDNFEAMALRPTADGSALIYLLSDDNQSDKQQTLLLQFQAQLQQFQIKQK
jgi:hypothetical protein